MRWMPDPELDLADTGVWDCVLMPDAGRDRAGSNTSNGETKSNIDFGACWGGGCTGCTGCTGGDCTGGVGLWYDDDDSRRSGAGAGCVMTGSPRGATFAGGLYVS